jgi:hypothetical protein
MDPNPSSFLPLFYDPHNSTNLSSTTTIFIYHLSLSSLVSYHPLLTACNAPFIFYPNTLLLCNLHNSNFDSRDKRVTFLVLFSVSVISINNTGKGKDEKLQ